MRKILLSVLFVAVSVFSFGQIFEMYTPESELVNEGDTVYCSGSAGDLLAGHVYVKNVSPNSQNVYTRKSYVSLLPGVIDAFCWAGSCYTSMVSPNYEIIDAGATATDFSTEYMPQDIVGISVIRYAFFSGHGDSTWFFIKYTSFPTSVGSNDVNRMISNPFPNPSSDNINYYVSDLQGSMTINIHNLTGQVIKTVVVQSTGLLQIEIKDLKAGVYIAEVKSGLRVIKTSRIIVR